MDSYEFSFGLWGFDLKGVILFTIIEVVLEYFFVFLVFVVKVSLLFYLSYLILFVGYFYRF